MQMGTHSLVLGAFLGLLCVSSVLSQVASRKRVFTDRTEELARRAASGAGDFYGRLDAAHQAVVALDSVDSLRSIDSAKLCQAASNASVIQLEDAYQSIQVYSRLRCLNAKISSAAAEVAVHHLATADNVLAAFQSINVLSTLHQAKTLSQQIDAPQIERIIHLFKNLSSSQGSFKLSSSSPKRSILATGLVYRTLADARALEVSLSDETEGIVEEIRASLAQVLKVSKGGEALLALSGDEDKVHAAAQLVIGAAAIYDGSAITITASQLSGAAQLLGGAFHVGSLADAAAVGPALQALTTSPLPSPLLATLASPRIKASQQDTVGLTVMDAWGQPASVGSVTVHSSPLEASSKGKAQPSSQTLQAGSSSGEYLYSTAHLHSHPGTYTLTVEVTDASGSPAGQSQLMLTVSDEVQLDSISLAFSDGESQAAINETLPYPQALGTKSATLDPSQTLKVSLAMSAKHGSKSVVPQQRMLRLTSLSNKAAAAYFNLKPSKLKDNTYSVSITSTSLHKQAGSQDGAYSMDVLIGDNALDVPVIWPLGTVAVSHHSSDEPQTGLAATEALFRPKPEIVHIGRAPGKRPLSVVSMLFTGLALAPLGLLYLMLSSVGANLKGFPKGGASRLAAIAFHGGILSILGLYTLFWLKLNLIQTLPWLLVLGVFTTVAGYNALSRLADSSIKQQ
ncbi:proteasome regulatory particle base subunit [Trebouxia sp. C0010 RCD-2024]